MIAVLIKTIILRMVVNPLIHYIDMTSMLLFAYESSKESYLNSLKKLSFLFEP